MKLLKSFGGEEVEMMVVSILDSTSSMVSADTLVVTNGWGWSAGVGLSPTVHGRSIESHADSLLLCIREIT